MIPISQTLPDVNLDEILAALDTDTRDYLLLLLNDGAEGLGSERKGRELAAGDPAPGADREVRARDQRGRWPSGALNLRRVVHNFWLLTTSSASATRSSRTSCRTPTRCSPRWPSRTQSLRLILQKLPGTLRGHADHAGQGRDAGRHRGADARSRCGRRRARWPVAAADAAVPARVDADHPRRDPAVRARGAADGAGAAAGDARPGGDDAGPDGARSASSTGS